MSLKRSVQENVCEIIAECFPHKCETVKTINSYIIYENILL